MDTVKPLPMNAKIQSIYRYPVKGLSPEALTRVTLAARPDPARRPRLRDRERPLRLRPGSSAIFSEDALPDADEERAAGRARHPLRRRKPHADHPAERRRGRARRFAHAGGPRRDRGFFCALQFRRTARPAENPAGRRPQLFGRRGQGGVDHQPGLGRRGRRRGRSAGRSVALSRQPACRRLAGLAGIRSARTDARDRGCAAQGGETDRPLCRHQCGAAHRHPRSRNPEDADAGLRPHGLRGLCRGRSTGGAINQGDAIGFG